jgi:glutathione S-transferase
VEFYNTDLKGFYGMSFSELNPSMTLPVLIDETFCPKLNVHTECSRICNYLATEAIAKPVSCGLLQANTLVPPQNSKNRGLYDTQMSWILTHFSPKAALAVERLELLRRDRSRTDVKIGPSDRKFHDNYNQLKTELDALEFFLWKGPVFLCEVGLAGSTPEASAQLLC